jgi:site-specific DNA-methyltransferase (adenine-specific)
MATGMTNKLFYGDNLDVLREHIADESVDLIYLDPPFNSNASYNILFKSPAGAGADASIEAFDDTWSWGPAASSALMDITQSGNHALHTLMQAMKTAIGENAMMAYLAMMAVRLVELHRVLKPTGSLYLHCDPTASHYLKLVLDAVFGPKLFQNEIIWKRTHAHGDSRLRFASVTDTILFYAKSDEHQFNRAYMDYPDAYLEKYYRYADDDGRRYQLVSLRSPSPRPNLRYDYKGVSPHVNGWAVSKEKMAKLDAEGRLRFPDKPGQTIREKYYLDEMPGVPVTDLWDDIPPINSQAQERLGYPTQKPRALLERIIAASSSAGGMVLDPFCGCGTAVDAAQKLGRQWIGIDITHLAIGLVEKRLREGYGNAVQFETIGVPRDLASAQRLAADDPHQFQAWITLALGGWPWMGGKKGGDKGVDGYFYYVGDNGQTETGVISVKAGNNINPGMVRDLGRVMERDGHALGLFVCAALPTKGMEAEANSHGLFETHFGGATLEAQRYPKLQIFTLAELFQDRRPKLPPLVSPNRRAARVETRASHKEGAQGSLI